MNTQPRRAVITGIGLVCPLGSSPDALWEGLVARRSAVAEIDWLGDQNERTVVRFAAEARQFRGEIDEFGALDPQRKKAIRKGLKVMCRECQMGVAAAQMALEDAGLVPSALDPDRSGVSFGSDHMITMPDDFVEAVRACLNESGRFEFARWAASGLPKMSPLWLLKYLPNMPASHLTIYNDLRGPNNSLTLREISSHAAIGDALHAIRRGVADVMVAGATGSRVHPLKLVHAAQQEELASTEGDPAAASRPFDLGRTGMVLGEGAGAVVVEEASRAAARGATIHGEIVASAVGVAVRRPLTADRRRAAAHVLDAVLREAGMRPEDVGHLHAHGLSTRRGDVEEAQAVADVFGSVVRRIPVVAAKANFGNLGAGSGAVELAASLMALRRGNLFPVLNFNRPDPECPVAPVVDDSTPAGDAFISLSITPQGQAAAVLIRRATAA